MYATVSQYRQVVQDAEVVEATNLNDPDALVIDADHIDRALISASNQINAALAGRYSVPVYPPPPDLIRICIRLARWELEVYELREIVKEQYEAAIADLNAYRSGASVLVGADNKPAPLKPTDPSQATATSTTVGQRKTISDPGYLPPYPARGSLRGNLYPRFR